MLTLSILIIASCDNSLDNPEFNSNINNRSDQDAYDQLVTALDDDQIISDNFYLRSAEVVDSVLHVTVSYSGGCREHSFELVWPEAIIMIFPPQFNVILLHDSNNDLCEAAITETLIFELSENGLGLSKDVFSLMKLGIINGSNPDEIVNVNE